MATVAESVALAPLLLPNSSSSQTLEALGTVFGGFLSSSVVGAFKPMEMLALVKGEGTPSPAIVRAAEMGLSFLANDEMSPMAIDMVMNLLSSRGVKASGLVDLSAMLGKIILPGEPVRDNQGVRRVLQKTLSNIVNSSPHPVGRIHRCEDCGQVSVIPN